MAIIPNESTINNVVALKKLVRENSVAPLPIEEQIELVLSNYRDREKLDDAEFQAKWNPIVGCWYDAHESVSKLAAAAVSIKNKKGFKGVFQKVITGSLVQDFSSNQSKDYFYELELASVLCSIGYEIEFREPDLLVSGSDLEKPIGIACKNPSSIKQVHDHISKGYWQIAKQRLDGIVAISLEVIAMGPQVSRPIILKAEQENPEYARDCLDRCLVELKRERKELYPSEKPIDGMLLTFFLSVRSNFSTCLRLRSFASECEKENPVAGALLGITERINKAG